MGIKHKFVSAVAEGADAGKVRVSNWNEEHDVSGDFYGVLINGGMKVDQRNAGASQTITAAAALAYTIDRWYAYCAGADVDGEQIAGSGSSQFRYQFTGAASVSAIRFGQRIEANNSYGLNGKDVVFSVDLANSVLTTVTWKLNRPTTTKDTFGTIASPTVTELKTGTFTVDGDITRYEIKIPAADVNSTLGLEIVLSVAAQTSGTWTIGNVKLEVGETATDFVARHYEKEEALCQRYYQRFGGGTDTYFVMCGATGATGLEGTFMYIIPMRAAPTFGSGGNFETNLGAIALTALGTDLSTTISARISGTVAGGLTQGFAYNIRADSDATAYMQFAAEL